MWEIMGLLLVFVFVIGSAYFITKKIALIGSHRMQGKNLEIIESLQLGISQMIHLVRVGDKVLIIGVTKDKITYLSEVDKDTVNLDLYKKLEETPTFEDYFKKVMPKKK